MSAEQQTFSFFRGGQRPAAAQSAAAQPLVARNNLVIEAGAGTGKTTAIVGRALKLLLGEHDVAPERVVLVTFTEKAAGEIADRIQSALAEIQGQLDANETVCWPADSDKPIFTVDEAQRDVCRTAIARQMARIDSLRSQTIHAFCQSLLRQYPIEADIDPQFRIVEGFDRSLLYDEVYDDWIDEETRLKHDPNAAREWEAMLEQCNYLFIARTHIFSLLEKRHLLSETRYGIGSIAEYEQTLIDAVLSVRDRGSEDHPIVDYLQSTAPPDRGSSIEAWIEYFAPIASRLREVDLKDLKSCKDTIRDVLRGKDKKTCVYDLLVAHRAAEAALSLTRRFIKKLDAEKRARGVLDFDDLLLLTRRLLDNPAVLERVRNQFDFLFVDEFQDTDRVQAEILRLLATDSSGRFISGKLAVVGDPKQSIYAFRRADPETYAQFTGELLEAGGEPELLVDQYRSTRQMVSALNAIGPELFKIDAKDANPNVFSPEYHALTAARKAESSGPPLTFIGSDPDPEREAEAVVQWIRAREQNDLRRFALLFRRKRHIETFLDVFDREKLDYVVPPMGLFLDRPAAVDLLAVLRAIAYSYDLGSRIAASRSPYFALTDAEIAAGVAGAEGPWAAAGQSLDAFREAAKHLTVTALIDHIVKTTGIEAVYRNAGDTRSPRHLEQVRAIAFTYDQKAGGSVRQFVEEIARRREVPEEVEPSLLDETTNAVRVLTVHGAKGLEFENVILPDIEFSGGGGQGVEAFTVEDPPSLVLRNGLETLSGTCRSSEGRPLKDIGGLRDKAETRRLFYVAITRAKSKLAIVCNPAKIKASGFGKFVKEIFDISEESFPAEPGRIEVDSPFGRIAFERSEPPVAVERAVAADDEPLAECIVPHPEALTTPLPRKDIRIARAAAANRSAGILLHRALERWDGRSDPSPLLAKLAAETAADDRSIDLVRGRLMQVASSAVFRRITSAETIGREMPIAFLDESGTLVERRIDRLVRENEIDLVVDYKSGQPAETRLERDREQVTMYCQAVAKMTGRPCRGLLWYIDEENDVAVDVSS